MAKTIRATSISNLIDVNNLTDNDLFVVSQEGTPKKLSFGSLKTLMNISGGTIIVDDNTTLTVDKNYRSIEKYLIGSDGISGHTIYLNANSARISYATEIYRVGTSKENLYCEFSLYTTNDSTSCIKAKRSINIEISKDGNTWYPISTSHINAAYSGTRYSTHSVFANIVVTNGMCVRASVSEVLLNPVDALYDDATATGILRITAVSDEIIELSAEINDDEDYESTLSQQNTNAADNEDVENPSSTNEDEPLPNDINER